MTSNQNHHFDAVVIGAGFSGMYMLYRLREAGFSTCVFEAADNVGGVWYWNRYPGARCDSESIYYNYMFSEELYKEWTWSSKFSPQPEILSYLNFVANKLDLRKDIQFNTRVEAACYDEKKKRWNVKTNDGNTVSAKYFITGVGCLSAANIPNIKGLDTFTGQWYHTGAWPHEGVDFKGKRVGIIGTGSSGIQAIPVIAEEAKELTVFQRTPQYTVPARNHLYDPEYVKRVKENFQQMQEEVRLTATGLPGGPDNRSALEDTPEDRTTKYEAAWKSGGFAFNNTYYDLTINEKSNETAAAFIRSKIQDTVHNPAVAKKLLPNYFYGTKRPPLDTNYYETYNRENVTLVDVKAAPITEITQKGIKTTQAEHELDIIVFATGYDAMTGALLKIDIQGKNGLSLKEKWDDGKQVKTYLGLAIAGFPNMFTITGPESPSVLSNMPVSIEQHVDWIFDCIQYMKQQEIETIEANPEAEQTWSNHCRQVAEATLFTKTESWYTGANIAGKAKGFPIYLGGVGAYRKKCDEVVANGYEGFLMVFSWESVK